jgi:manganese-dependent inorganic pyrophosphatase
MSIVYITGHKNPDTDSIASAWAYTQLKNKLDPDNTYVAARCGHANSQTKYIFSRAGVDLPRFIKDVYPKAVDLMVTDVHRVLADEPVANVFHTIEESGGQVQVVPVVDNDGMLKGVVSATELLRLFVQEAVDQRPKYLFDAEQIATVIKGTVVCKGSESRFNAALMIGAMSMERSTERLEVAGASETVLVVGNRHELIEYAMSRALPAIIITGVKDAADMGVDCSNYNGWIFLSNLDSAETVRRVILATPVSSIMSTSMSILAPEDYLDSAKDMIISSKHRAIMVADDKQKLVGVLTRSDLLKKYRHRVILMDHNEPSQAVDGIDSADVLEIVDHHRLGAVKTSTPVTFYAKPVGSTCTLVYQLYKSAGVVPDKTIALILMSGIISDTVILKSPTVTDEDKAALAELEMIAGVKTQSYGIDIFSATDSLASRTPESIVMTDFKKYTEYGISMGIGQVEVVTLANLDEMQPKLLAELNRQRQLGNLDWAMLLVTDIIMEESVLITTDFADGEKLLAYKKLNDNQYTLPGILSRKKQLLPEILRIAEELQ